MNKYYVTHVRIYGQIRGQSIEFEEHFATEQEAADAAKATIEEARKYGIPAEAWFTYDYTLRALLEGS